MGQEFINGAKYSFSTTLAAAVAITAISNALPAVATASPAPTEGSVIVLESNWTDLNDQATFAGPTGALALIDTTDTSEYPPGQGAGTYQTAGGFTSLSQIRDITPSGGDTNNFTWAYVDDKSPRQRSKPTDKNPLILTFTMDYDPTLPWHDALVKLDKNRQLVVMRETLPTGDVLLYTGFVSFNANPTRGRNENMEVVATMSINSQLLRFPAGFTGS